MTDEAKQRVWETYKKAKTEIDKDLEYACLSTEKFCDDAIKDAYATINRAERERDEDVGRILEDFVDAYDKVERIYHEALATIVNTEKNIGPNEQ